MCLGEWIRMNRFLQVVCGVTLAASVPAIAGAQDFVTLQSGDVVVSIDSYGRVGQGLGVGFHSGAGMTNQIYEHLDFFSTGGPTQQVGDSSTGGMCSVIIPVAAEAADHAASIIQCGLCTFELDFRVDGTAGTWTTNVVASGCNLGCYYAYTDYDIITNLNNEGAYHPADVRPQFVVHNSTTTPEIHYQFGAVNPPDHYQQGAYPFVQQAISNAQSCIDLADAPAVTDPVDWTGALQFSTFGPTQTVGYVHGRDDSVAFP